MTSIASFDNEQWLTRRLGADVSRAVRDLVRDLVVDGPWALEDASTWKVTLVLHQYVGDRHTRTELVIWLQYSRGGTRRFGSAEIWHCERIARPRRLDRLAALIPLAVVS